MLGKNLSNPQLLLCNAKKSLLELSTKDHGMSGFIGMHRNGDPFWPMGMGLQETGIYPVRSRLIHRRDHQKIPMAWQCLQPPQERADLASAGLRVHQTTALLELGLDLSKIVAAHNNDRFNLQLLPLLNLKAKESVTVPPGEQGFTGSHSR